MAEHAAAGRGLVLLDRPADDAAPARTEHHLASPVPMPSATLRRVGSQQACHAVQLEEGRALRVRKYTMIYGTMSTRDAEVMLQEEKRFRQEQAHQHDQHPTRARPLWQDALVNFTSGTIAFLLSATLAVSCASVIVGHGTPLSLFIADFIAMDFLGTAVLCVVLAAMSSAPWTLGSIDVFVVPVMCKMAQEITAQLDADMDRVVPTTIVMVAMVSAVLGAVFFLMGVLRVTSAANYMPYPVIAGFLSGIGMELMKNGMHMAATKAFTVEFFTWPLQALLWPAILFAALARIAQYLRIPATLVFPSLLVLSFVLFHVIARVVLGYEMSDLKALGWVFAWPDQALAGTRMWFPWANVDFALVEWSVLMQGCFPYMVSLVILSALKYSVATTSLTTLIGRTVSADQEMRVIGLANLGSGLLGCCGGCHYISAMGIMKQFNASERMPALLCAGWLVLLWVQGIHVLEYVPKFVFGGLVLHVGLHFVESYFIAPFRLIKRIEQGMIVLITVSFVLIGMLEAVALGVLISIIDLVVHIHRVGCVHHETTGQLTRSSVDRTPEQSAYLDAHGGAIFILRLQGYLFFGTSVNVLERIDTRARSTSHERLQFVIIDFGLVPSFDATALLNFRKAVDMAEQHCIELFFCGLKPLIERKLRRHPQSTRVHYRTGNVDTTLERCESLLLPPALRDREDLNDMDPCSIAACANMTHLELWERFLQCFTSMQDEQRAKLLPLAAYLDKQELKAGEYLCAEDRVLTDTCFLCCGFMNILAESEFSHAFIPGVQHAKAAQTQVHEHGDSDAETASLADMEMPPVTPPWRPFTTARARLRKIGPGSILTPDTFAAQQTAHFYQYLATSDCVLLRLRADAMDRVEHVAPHTAVAVLKLINLQISMRFLYSNKRVTQLSSLLYK